MDGRVCVSPQSQRSVRPGSKSAHFRLYSAEKLEHAYLEGKKIKPPSNSNAARLSSPLWPRIQRSPQPGRRESHLAPQRRSAKSDDVHRLGLKLTCGFPGQHHHPTQTPCGCRASCGLASNVHLNCGFGARCAGWPRSLAAATPGFILLISKDCS